MNCKQEAGEVGGGRGGYGSMSEQTGCLYMLPPASYQYSKQPLFWVGQRSTHDRLFTITWLQTGRRISSTLINTLTRLKGTLDTNYMNTNASKE